MSSISTAARLEKSLKHYLTSGFLLFFRPHVLRANKSGYTRVRMYSQFAKILKASSRLKSTFRSFLYVTFERRSFFLQKVASCTAIPVTSFKLKNQTKFGTESRYRVAYRTTFQMFGPLYRCY